MEIKQLTESIHQIEQGNDVNAWKIKGIYAWPVVRYLALINFKRSVQNKEQLHFKPSSKPSFLERLQHLYIFLRHLYRFRKEIRRYKSLPPVNVLCFSRSSDYHDKIGDKDYNKLIDPYVDYCKKNNIPCLKLEVKDPRILNRFNVPYIIDDEDLSISYRSGAGRRHLYEEVPDNVLKQLNDLTNYNITSFDVNEIINRIFYYRELFLKILRHLKPQTVFLSGYYTVDTFGLILAAKELNISTVDVQHGKQGKFHPMYSHWSSIPEGGYQLLPDYFWNWGEESKHNIQIWMKDGFKFHTPVIGGNLWLSMWKFKEVDPGKIAEGLLADLTPFTKTVMVSLQPIDDALPEFLIDAIRENKNWFWLIRLHPAMKNDSSKALTELRGFSNVDIDRSSSLPLYFLLSNTDIHLTAWSSVCFEALSFNIPTVIYHTIGESLFGDYIQSGVFKTGYSKEGIISAINSFNGPVKDEGYILTDKKVIEAGFEKIWSGKR